MPQSAGQRVAIVGRPNVGKSTLFNRLVGRRRAIVDDTPGVTRDVREAPAQLGDLAFTLLDTAGWETTGGAALEARMRRFTERAIEGSDVVLFLIDARAGILPLDESFAGWLRKRADKVILVANKCEGRAGQQGLAEAHGLGLGEPIPVSAEHGEGPERPARGAGPASSSRWRTRTDEPAGAEREPRPTSRSPSGRCCWPSSAGPTSASRPCSTAWSARSGC